MLPTPKQKQVSDYIKQFSDLYGFCPSCEQIKEALGYKSKSTIHAHLKALEERGLIKRTPYKARAIEIVRQL